MASIAAIVIYSKIKKLSVLKTIDIIAFAFALGVACGRIGCFLNGCCWGDVTVLGYSMAGLPLFPSGLGQNFCGTVWMVHSVSVCLGNNWPGQSVVQ